MSFPLMPFTGNDTTSAGSAFITSGQTFLVPAGVTSLSVSLRGAGGSGGSGRASPSVFGGSGGSGALVTQTSLAVTPGETLNMSGGAGGTGGNAGGTSFFRRGATNLMSAGGGAAGTTGTYFDGQAYPGNPGAPSGAGSGGTITTGGGAPGGAGSNTSTHNPGSAGSTFISWIQP